MQLRHPDSPEDLTVPLPPPASGLSLCAVVALSDDLLLLEALAGAVSEGSPVSSSPSTDRFIDQLMANGGGIALVDAASVAAPLKNFLATLRDQFPQLLVLLTGTAQLQTQVATQIADGTIFRFVHKPASSQRLRLFLDAALRQQVAMNGPRPAAAAAALPAARAPSSGGRGGLAITGLSGAVLAAGVVAWAIWQHATSPSPSTPKPPDQAPPANVPEVEQNPPPAATAAPQEQPAAEGQITRENATRDAALEQAQRNVQGARADQLAVYLQLARKRLASGALIEPVDDSARAYLDSALVLAPEDADVRATSLALGDALIAQFRRALASGDAAEAQRWLTACGNYHIGSATLNQLSTQLQQLQQLQLLPSTAPLPTADSTATAAAPVVMMVAPEMPAPAAALPIAMAAAVVPAAPTVVNESTLSRVQFVSPTYPEQAFAHAQGGWVEMEFTVTPGGQVTDVTVTASEPGNVFDSAARSALSRSRYQPVLRDGKPVAQRARIRVRFQP